MTEQEQWLEENCPTLHSLRNKKKDWPGGFLIFSRGPTEEEILADNPMLTDIDPEDDEEQLRKNAEFLKTYCAQIEKGQKQRGRELFQELELAFEELSAVTHVGTNFKDLVRGANTENQIKELLTEVNVANALCRVSKQPALSPQTNPPSQKGQKGKNCDFSGFIQDHKVWFEIKAYSDDPPEKGKARVRSLSQAGFQQSKKDGRQTERPRAGNLRNKLTGQTKVGKPPKGVPEQFKDGEINIVIVNEMGWDSHQHLAAAFYGDHWRLATIENIESPTLFEDGLFAEERWKKVSAGAGVVKNGNSIRLTWFLNPNAKVPIPEAVLEVLRANFGITSKRESKKRKYC